MGGDREKAVGATALMQELERHLEAKNLAGAEKTADSVRRMMAIDLSSG